MDKFPPFQHHQINVAWSEHALGKQNPTVKFDDVLRSANQLTACHFNKVLFKGSVFSELYLLLIINESLLIMDKFVA